MDKLLRESKVIVCAGSGGVGKTTMSASIAVRAAQIGLNVLVLTVDPAKRLATALGLKSLTDEDTLVPDQNYKGKLHAALVNPRLTFDRFITKYAPNPDVSNRLKRNSLYASLTTTLSGSQEFTSLERLCNSVESKKYDLVILDTPPTGHAIEFLDATKKLENFLHDSVLKWFLAPFEKQNAVTQLLNRGTKVVLNAFEFVVGAELVNELMDFLGCIYQYREALQNRFKAMRELLEDKSTRFVLITGFDEEKLMEARYFKNELDERNLTLSYVVVNRAFPLWFKSKESAPASGASNTVNSLSDYYDKLAKYFDSNEKAFTQFQIEVQNRVRFLRIVDFDQEIYDLRSLESMAEEIVKASGA